MLNLHRSSIISITILFKFDALLRHISTKHTAATLEIPFHNVRHWAIKVSHVMTPGIPNFRVQACFQHSWRNVIHRWLSHCSHGVGLTWRLLTFFTPLQNVSYHQLTGLKLLVDIHPDYKIWQVTVPPVAAGSTASQNSWPPPLTTSSFPPRQHRSLRVTHTALSCFLYIVSVKYACSRSQTDCSKEEARVTRQPHLHNAHHPKQHSRHRMHPRP